MLLLPSLLVLALQRFVTRWTAKSIHPSTPDFHSLEVAVQGTTFASSAGLWPVPPGHGSVRR